ncbi:MAG: MATE family efflux transporter [Muribaculum sp.]|nr:MATE family efflux transporter [Muribaculum sp.]
MRSINREILAIAVPSIITNITTPLLALMDVVIVGHMGNPVYIAAISVGGTLFNMMYWLFAFLRMGSSGLTAQAHGASNIEETNIVLIRGLLVAACASILILLFQSIICSLSLDFMEVEENTRQLSEQYFRILVWGAPAVLGTYSLSGWYLGLKNAKTPMWISFIINITNIIVSLFLVYVFKLKITGVATGTLTAQWVGFIVGIIIAWRKYHPTVSYIHEIINTKELKRFFSINTDIFFRTLCLIAVTAWFTRVGSQQGTIVLAVNTLLMQFFIMFSYFMDGFAFAGESLCGNFIGAGHRKKLKECINSLFGWGVIMALLFSVFYAIGGELIMNLMTTDHLIIEKSKEYIIWVILVPFAGFASFTWDGIYIGATQTRAMLISMLISSVLYFGIYFLLFNKLGNHGLWVAFIVYLISRGIILTLLRHRLTMK